MAAFVKMNTSYWRRLLQNFDHEKDILIWLDHFACKKMNNTERIHLAPEQGGWSTEEKNGK